MNSLPLRTAIQSPHHRDLPLLLRGLSPFAKWRTARSSPRSTMSLRRHVACLGGRRRLLENLARYASPCASQGNDMRKLLPAIAFAAILHGITSASAQTYPSRPITMIAPFPAGGPSDTLARILAEPMRAALGQPVVIENVAGAGGNLGVGRLARAAPDGYTVGIGQWSTHVVNAVTYNAALRCADRLRADRAARDHAAAHHRAQEFPGERREGADRLAQGQPRQGDRREPSARPAARRSPPSTSSRRPAPSSASCPIAAARRRCRT